MASREKGTRFVVDLGELELPEEVAKTIEVEMRQAVMRAIARMDFRGDLRIRIPPGLYGFILDPKDITDWVFHGV